MNGWKKTPMGNFVKQGDGFIVSYQPKTEETWNSLSGMMGRPIDAGDSSETAIVKDKKYYILKGNHQKAYDPLVDKGFDACLAYYNEHLSERSDWDTQAFDEWKDENYG